MRLTECHNWHFMAWIEMKQNHDKVQAQAGAAFTAQALPYNDQRIASGFVRSLTGMYWSIC